MYDSIVREDLIAMYDSVVREDLIAMYDSVVREESSPARQKTLRDLK